MEGHPEQRSDTDEVHREGRFFKNRLQQPLELGAAFFQALPAGFALEDSKRRKTCGHRHGVP